MYSKHLQLPIAVTIEPAAPGDTQTGTSKSKVSIYRYGDDLDGSTAGADFAVSEAYGCFTLQCKYKLADGSYSTTMISEFVDGEIDIDTKYFEVRDGELVGWSDRLPGVAASALPMSAFS